MAVCIRIISEGGAFITTELGIAFETENSNCSVVEAIDMMEYSFSLNDLESPLRGLNWK